MPASQRGAGPEVRTGLLPKVVTFGILAFGILVGAGGAKGVLAPPPDAMLIPIYFLLAVSFFVVATCMWFVGGVFTDPRFTSADPGTRVRLAREALAPVLALLGMLHRAQASSAPAS